MTHSEERLAVKLLPQKRRSTRKMKLLRGIRRHSEGSRETEKMSQWKSQNGYRGRRITVRVERHINPKKDKWPQMLCVETNKISLDVTIPREVTGDP